MEQLGFDPRYKTHRTLDISAENEGEKAKIAGWVVVHRDKSKIIFIKIRDATGIAQIVIKKDEVDDEFWEIAKNLTIESAISVDGIIVADSRSQTGAELKPSKITILQLSDTLPIDLSGIKTETMIETIFEHRELSIRRPESIAIFKIKHHIARAVRDFYVKNGFYEIWTPYILGTSTEGGAEMFKVDYFGQEGVLAQSCQFYKQSAIAVHEKVFGIIPSWRAEKSRTPKHVVEFHQIETEIAFGTDETIMQIQENLLYSVMKHVIEHCSDDLKVLGRELKLPSLPFKRITFEDAKKLGTKLVKEQLDMDEPEGDLSTPAETALSNHFEDPFFIIRFPTEIRGMYYDSDPNDDDITLSLDLVASEGIGELSSGGVRVTSPDKLIHRIKEKGYNPDSFKWYIDMFRYGGAPHAGFGLGFERLTRFITGVKHIRETIMYPRTPDYWSP
ncbi:MAG: aspartate--tRNA(Asn) ligase [Candidatus Heimdallarchaeota archaeon]|nr:aspartate--tRNA(Asn) ligase [Candidatus Heimdallarchaeota archaeon]MDH5646476.1 aspartate--tRNA(Asn) ligase [Candidatus Heimdallarchaeota archaeon]